MEECDLWRGVPSLFRCILQELPTGMKQVGLARNSHPHLPMAKTGSTFRLTKTSINLAKTGAYP
jgi:hypothetical protein